VIRFDIDAFVNQRDCLEQFIGSLEVAGRMADSGTKIRSDAAFLVAKNFRNFRTDSLQIAKCSLHYGT
jgi:hypothetical protein